MYKDIIGTEIKIGHVIAVARYGRGKHLYHGIVTEIVKTKKTTWVHFTSRYGYRAKLGAKNSNISVLKVGEDNQRFSATVKALISAGTLPSDYILGEPVEEEGGINIEDAKIVLEQAKKVISEKDGGVQESLLDSLGAPKSLGG